MAIVFVPRRSALLAARLRSAIRAGLLILAVALLCTQTALAGNRVLIIHSYHSGLSWTDEIMRGIRDVFDPAGDAIELTAEYLDARRFPDAESAKLTRELLVEKLKKLNPDLVLVSDNAALDFALLHRYTLFSKVPIVFCGINNYTPSRISGFRRVTGVAEDVSVADTVHLALRLHPGTEEIIIIGRTSVASDKANRDSFAAALPDLSAGVAVTFWDDVPMGGLRARLERLKPGSLVFINGLLQDETGRQLMYGETTEWVRSSTSVPLYSLWDVYLGHGIVGGRLVSGYRQGRLAAEQAKRILKGENPDSIPVVSARDANRYMFDDRQLKRFDLKPAILPRDSVIVNLPDSFYTRYRSFIWTLAGVILGLGVFIVVLALALVRQRRAEEQLRLANRVVENSPLVLFRWKATAEWPIETVSNNVSRFGYEPGELLSGRIHFSSLVHPDDLERVTAEVNEFCRRGEDRFQQEYRIVTKEGEVVWVEDRTVLERDAGGRITHFQGILIDITDRKRTEMVLSARVRLLQFAATHPLDDLLQATLDEAEKLTGSSIGFYHYLEADQNTLSLQNWSTRTQKEFCKAEGKGLHYDVASAGVWVECIQQRRPVIHNDYAALPHRKGVPPGHAPLVRELVVPVLRGGSIEAVFGVGNKAHDYTSHDVETVSLLADLAWGIVGLKKAEAALSESERRYRTIIEHAPFGIVRATREGKLLSANPAFAAILKYDSPEELLDAVNRTSVHEALFVEPSLRESIIERIFSGDSWHVLENRYRCRDGSIITCKVHSRMVPAPDGNGCEFESFLENITERLEAEQALRESEEKFRVLAETSPAAIALYQGEGLVYINPTTSRLIGYSLEELSGFSFWDCVHDDFRELVRERGLARLRGEALPEQYECKFVTKDGRELWALIAIGRIEYKGKPAGIVTLIDTTEAKLADERMRASLAEKEVLLKEVHHRVKNNLQIISSLLDLQSDYLRDERSRAIIRESQNRIRSMALIHQKLYQSESFAFVNFREYIEELAADLFASYARDPLLIELHVAVGDVTLGMDEAIPCGIIVNELVSNALKHAFPGGRGGVITIRCDAGDEGCIALSVADNGVGLPHGFVFRNAESLGLQLVSMLVKQLGGRVTFSGEQGGTVAAVTFPSAASCEMRRT